MDALAQQYEQAAKPVLFIEYSVNDDGNQRVDRWYSAYDGQRDLALPLVSVDSGWRWTCGGEDYATVYSAMVDAALANPAGAELGGSYWRHGDDVHVRLQVTNRSGRMLGPDNHAAVNVIVYEKAHLMHTDRFARASAEFPLGADLADGQGAVYDVELADIIMPEWGRAVLVGVLDYRPDADSERYAALQSAVIEETAPPTATASPVPSPTGTASPVPSPTATASSTPTPTATASPTPSPTQGGTPTGAPSDAPTLQPTETPDDTSTPASPDTPSEAPPASPTATIAPSATQEQPPPAFLPAAFSGSRLSGGSGLDAASGSASAAPKHRGTSALEARDLLADAI